MSTIAGSSRRCWAFRAATGVTSLPTVPEFRAAANKPDKPGPTGGNITDIMRAVGRLWPSLGVVEYEHPDWDTFARKVKDGQIASLAILSSALPRKMRFGFDGAHQIGLVYENGFLMANPLAPQGSAPIPISEAYLKNAALAVSNGWVLAALFPRSDDMQIHLKAEDWTPTLRNDEYKTNGVFRDSPYPGGVTIDRAAPGEVVRSIAEVKTTTATNNDWRLTRRKGVDAYMLWSGKTDWIPVKWGGDPAVDQLLTDLVDRKDASSRLTEATTIAKKAAADIAAL